MKKLLLAGFYLLIASQAISQISFSPAVKKFMDYDTSVIAFTHCKLADVRHLKVLDDQTVIASQGCNSFKGYMFVDKPTLKAAIDEAHAKGLKVTGHLCAVTYREAAEMGIDQLEHGFSVSTDFVPNKKENACPLFAAPIASADSPKVKDLIRFLSTRR